MNEKQYKNISEVSKLLSIKEHVIRHWDSIDPKTNEIRFKGLSTRTKGGTRYFNKENIKKLELLKNLLFNDQGKRDKYSLDLASKIITSSRYKNINKNSNLDLPNKQNVNIDKLNKILSKLRNLENIT